MVDPREPGEDELEAAEEARVLYVGLTRALARALPPPFARHPPDAASEGRRARSAGYAWASSVGRSSRWRCAAATSTARSHRAPCSSAATPVAIQRYLRESVRPGDPVELRLAKATAVGDPLAFYAIEHEGSAIGLTSRRFAETLFRVLKISAKWKVNWPVRIEGIHVESVDSVAGTAVASHRAGLGQSGLWLRPRVFGLGDLVFERMQRGGD